MGAQQHEIGMIGLGVMGRNLVLNMADHGFPVVGYDKDAAKVEALRREAGDRPVRAASTLPEFISQLRTPRAIMMLVPAGAPVDAVIGELQPHLQPQDVVIDGGNSFFRDTDRRVAALAAARLQFLGVGVSGGEHGARFGPSIMPGGPREAYERVRPVLEAVAAKVDGAPCVTYLGPGSAGHYVKMVHNGIEYGLMELIAEAYDLMKRGLGFDNDRLHDVFDGWNRGELNGYLIEITTRIFRQADDKTGRRLVDLILDEAKQKGTGKWTSQDAMDLQVPVPTIDAAVAMRDMTGYKSERTAAARLYPDGAARLDREPAGFVRQLGRGLYAAVVLTYVQGMSLLRRASDAYGYGVALGDVARIWRGGCIIRAGVLESIRTAFERRPDLSNLLQDASFARDLVARLDDFRTVVQAAAAAGIPAPGLMAALGYFDAYRSGWLPANLTQAQRDYFGSHTYERVDESGVFHTQWNQD
ncbi:MAG TPA: NADP-dependent phosphogluconate dehydrogenase [Vicinamibacterales bacterium]|nr:NADP-dependent phosphogluconate dehydrogenase [Vicinamibacterales bacterium]